MYLPDAFAETDRGRLHDLIEAYDFAMLITGGTSTPAISHLPFVLDRNAGPNGTLQAHMARANPQWQSFNGEALVVFRGPHSYVSPTWYEPGTPAVPTWNYAVVHAYGTPRIIDDAAAVRAQQERLIAVHESGRTPPWSMAGQPADFIDNMLAGIVAFAIPIARLVGKFKLSQNRPATDRSGVVAGLQGQGDAAAQGLAPWVAQGGMPSA